MWPFKKKLIEEKVEEKQKESKVKKGKKKEPEYKYDKDRFIVEIKKDENRFLVKVFDEWSDIFHQGKEKGLLNCRTVTFVISKKEAKKEEKYVSKVIDDAKEHLRKLFIEKRNKETKKNDKKEKSKE